jgi:hypothetical protein
MSQICEEVAIVHAKKEKLISAFQMKRRRRSKEWQRLRISLAFEHRFVIIGRI